MGSFSGDKSNFKTRILLAGFLSVAALAGSVMLSSMFVSKMTENNKQASNFASQNVWLQKFDYKDATNLYKLILKPCKASDVDNVQKEQLDILKDHKLTVVGVKNDKGNDKGPLKSRKTSVDLIGDWNDLNAALSDFEKKHFVVITNASVSTDNFNGANTGTQGLIKVKLDYNIYYN